MPREIRRRSGPPFADRSLQAGGTRGSAEPEETNDSSTNTRSLVEKRRFVCPVPECGHGTLEFKRAAHRDGGGLTVLIRCWNCHGRLNEISEATGISKTRLLTWPPPEELGPEVKRYRSTGSGDIAAPPSLGTVGGFHSALLSNPEALAYLETRGLTGETIERYELGYDRDSNAIVVPVWDEKGELDNLRRRFLNPKANPKILGLAGRLSQLYPDVPSGDLLLVAGEFDALVGRQMGLPTVTTTCGSTLPAHLADRLAERLVYVIYDVGEDLAAESTAEELRALGSEAVVVHLALLGLPEKGDLNDFYRLGGTAEQIKALRRRERRGA